MSDVAEFLASVPGFSAVGLDDLKELAERMTPRRFADGEHLLRRGDAGDHMLILRSGRVRVPLVDRATGEQRMVVNLGSKDLVGEMALLTGEPRTADVIAEGPVEALAVDRDAFQPILAEHPPLARFLTEILGRRLEQGGGIEKVGKYRLVGKLGEGATSKVYEALHPGLNRVVAMKMLSHALVYDRQFSDRFLQEARTIAGLTHPNIVQIFDTEQAYATYFIIMERVSGTDLADLLRAKRMLDPVEAMGVLRQVGQALAHAHERRIVHRDVKPANCAIDEEGRVKLMDFGIARRIPKQVSEERAKVVEGTPRYLAPEAAVGREVDGRADIYSLGIMAYEMVTGRVPFYSETIRDLLRMHVRTPPPDVTRVRGGLPEGLVRFIQGALIKRPEERLTDWKDIQRFLAPPNEDPIELRPRTDAETELLSVTFTPNAREQVRALMDDTMARLVRLKGVHLSHARLVPVGASTDAPTPVTDALSPLANSRRATDLDVDPG